MDSFSVVSAGLLSGGTLVGFASSTSDPALNVTIWDIVTDPSLLDEMLVKLNLIRKRSKNCGSQSPAAVSPSFQARPTAYSLSTRHCRRPRRYPRYGSVRRLHPTIMLMSSPPVVSIATAAMVTTPSVSLSDPPIST